MTDPTPCPRCHGPRVWIQHHGQPEARCRPCTTAHARVRRQAAEPLVDVVRALLAFGVPMDGSASWGLACAYCGRDVHALPALGHLDSCLWARLRDRVAGDV